ncbi:MAG: hypothetical protein HY788_10065 [Deltaproteobacteria bacterium]|nr:hypothetical protein [Deltaproteobacteria bacterium]
MTADPELLGFAAEVIQKHGGDVEQRSDHVFALLSPDLCSVLQLPEEVQLGDGGEPLLYGGTLLDRLIDLATGRVPLVYARLEAPYLKKEGFENLLGKDIGFAAGRASVGVRAEARTTYMVLACHYVALSDERKEGLVRVTVHENTGSIIAGLEQEWAGFQPQFFAPGSIPPHFPIDLTLAVSAALKEARVATDQELSSFFSSMRWRLARDVRNTREYYEALGNEMAAGLSNPNLGETQRLDREAKLRGLPDEMAQKTRDLERKYRIRVVVTARAAMRLLVPVAQIMVHLQLSSLKRSLKLIWNPVTRRLDPLVCENCRESMRTVHPSEKDGRIELLCFSCRKKQR